MRAGSKGSNHKPHSLGYKNIPVLREHQGVLNKDLVVYPNSVSIEVTNGVLWTSLPKIPGRFFLAWIKNYHFADINLFWKDIESNALLRVQSWYNKRKG